MLNGSLRRRVGAEIDSLSGSLSYWLSTLPDRFSVVLFAVTMALIVLEAGLFVVVANVVTETAQSARQAARMSHLWFGIEGNIGQMRALEWADATRPSEQVVTAHRAEGTALMAALNEVIAQEGGGQSGVLQTLSLYHSYRSNVDRLFELRASGAADAAAALDAETVDPLSDQLDSSAAHAAALENAGEEAALSDLERVEGNARVLAVFTIAADTLLVGILWLLMDAHRRARRAKTMFLARMSHELRTPLNAVLGFAQLLQMDVREPLGARQARYVTNIRSGGESLLGLINDVLDLSKIDAGKMTLEIAPVDLAEVVHETVRSVTPVAAERNVDVVDLVESLPVVPADRRRAGQIVLNGLSNAIKFSDPGQKVVVTGSIEAGLATVVIADEGPGISASDLKRVFEDFEQVQQSMDRNRDGIGLGLPLSRDLARAMAGDVRLESELGAGTRFILQLPIREPRVAVVHTGRHTAA